MSDQQFNTYAKFYDLLYKDKDYTKEADYIDHLLQKYTSKSREDISLLDLACGTGKHLFELKKLGYRHLSGSDISGAMIAAAKATAAAQQKSIQFHHHSFQEASRIPGNFDVVISMFSAINYIISFEDQLKTFRNIHGLLNENGLFVFDYWNGNAVVRDYSPVKVLRKQHEQAEIIRISNTSLDLIRQHATVTFTCLYLEDNQKISEFEEVHQLHYYFFAEIYNLLHTAGFDVLHTSPFPEAAKAAEPYDWNISIVAQKRKQ